MGARLNMYVCDRLRFCKTSKKNETHKHVEEPVALEWKSNLTRTYKACLQLYTSRATIVMSDVLQNKRILNISHLKLNNQLDRGERYHHIKYPKAHNDNWIW